MTQMLPQYHDALRFSQLRLQ